MNKKIIFPRSIQYLMAVAEHGNFTRAAKSLYVSQPTLSQQIKKLEELLQTELLNRSGKTVLLTESGKIYLRYAYNALNSLTDGVRAIHDIKNLEDGSIDIGLTPITDHLVCCLLKNFNLNYPNITLNILEIPQHEIETSIANGNIDIGIIFNNALLSNLQENGLESYKLFEDSISFVVGNLNSYVGAEVIDIEALQQESLILLNTDFVFRHYIDEYCYKHGIKLNIAIETNALNVVIEMVQTGTLSTILPKKIADMRCGLYSIPMAIEFDNSYISMVYNKKSHNSFAMLAFTELVCDWCLSKEGQIFNTKLTPCINNK